jgi:hypothetical protein
MKRRFRIQGEGGGEMKRKLINQGEGGVEKKRRLRYKEKEE